MWQDIFSVLIRAVKNLSKCARDNLNSIYVAEIDLVYKNVY